VTWSVVLAVVVTTLLSQSRMKAPVVSVTGSEKVTASAAVV